MTYDDDFIQLHMEFFGQPRIMLNNVGLSWPPPELLYMDADQGLREAAKDDEKKFIFERIRFSQITDEQREGMTNVARGAEYKYLTDPLHSDESANH